MPPYRNLIWTIIFKISVLLALTIFGCNGQTKTAVDDQQAEVADVSIINLIATPEKFENKTVRLIGIASIEFENTAIYLTVDDERSNNSKNAIWINLSLTEFRKFKMLNGDQVIIKGVFTETSQGHKSAYSGSLKRVSRMEQWK